MNEGAKTVIVTPDVQVAVRVVNNFQAALGGYLEALPVGEGFTVFIDEDGKAKGLPRNEKAESIVRAMLAKNGRIMLPGDYLVGPAIFVGIDDDGNAVDLPDAVIQEYFPELRGQ